MLDSEIREKECELSVLSSSLAALRKDIGKIKLDTSLPDDIDSLSVDSGSTLDSKEIQKILDQKNEQKDKLVTKLTKSDAEHRSLKETLALLNARSIPLRLNLTQTPQLTAMHIENKMKSLKGEISKKEAAIKELKTREEAFKRSISQRSSQFSLCEQKKNECSQTLPRLLEEISRQKETKNDISAQLIGVSSDLCALKQNLNELSLDVSSIRKKFGNHHSDISITSLVRLIEEAEKRGIPGVHGLLIDLLRISDKLYMAFERLLSKKLFSIVVDNEMTASALINLNKELKGGRVNIYPLSWSEEPCDDVIYPDPSSCIILESSFIVDPKMSENSNFLNLLKNVVGGNLLVDKLADAQKFARQHNCNCVTMEGEVIYRGAFLNKLGFSEHQDHLIPDYLAFSALSKKMKELNQEVNKLENKKSDLHQTDSVASLKLQELNSQKSTLLRQSDELWEELVILKRTIVQEQKLITEYGEQAADEQKAIDLINTELEELARIQKNPESMKSKAAAGAAELEAIESQIAAQFSKLSKTNAEISNLIAQLSTVETEIAKLSISQIQAHRNLATFEVIENQSRLNSALSSKGNQHAREIEGKVFEIEQKERELKVNFEKLKASSNRLNSDLEKSHKELTKISNLVQEANQKRFDLQIIVDNFEGKMKSLGIDEKAEEENLWAIGKLADKELIEKLKHQMMAKLKYTQKDRHNFEKLEEHFKVYGEYNSEIKELGNSKKAFSKLMGRLPSNRKHRPSRRKDQ